MDIIDESGWKQMTIDEIAFWPDYLLRNCINQITFKEQYECKWNPLDIKVDKIRFKTTGVDQCLFKTSGAY